MATGQGYRTKAAFKIETGAYGTSIALNGGGEYNQIHLVSENLSPAISYEKSVSLEGNAGAKSLFSTGKKYAGELVVEPYYRGLTPLIIAALGMSPQTYSPNDAGSGAYKHYIEPSNDMSTRAFRDGFEMTGATGNAIRRGTLAFEKDVSIWEFASAMFNSVSMESNPESVRMTFNAAAKVLTLDSATNGASTNWATPPNGGMLHFSDMSVYLKARDLFTISASKDVIVIREPGSANTDQNIDIADGTYTGWELAQLIANGANSNVTLTGNYSADYDEHQRRFTIKSDESFIIDGAGDLNETIGFTSTDTSSSLTQKSPWDAVPDAYAAFGDGDKVGVSSITWSLENNLDIESQDSESDQYIIEPERNGFRAVTGSIEIPRYSNDNYLKAVNGFTTYMMKIAYTGALIGGSNYEQFNILIPAIKFTNVGAPATGPELIKQSLSFEAESPLDFLDLTNFFNYDFNIRSLSTDSMNGLGTGIMTPYQTGIFKGDSNGVVEFWDGSSWTLSTDVAEAVTALKSYKNSLFIGTVSGMIYEYDGSSWSESTDTGATSVVDFEVYGGSLFALCDATGRVLEYDGSSWSESTDTSSTDSFRLKAYNGNLYMAGDDGNGKIWEFDGSSWSESTDFTAGTITYMGLEVHRGKLYATTVDGTAEELHSFNGSAWTQEGGISFEPRDIISWRGNLMLLGQSGQYLRVWDFSTSSDYAVTSDNVAAVGKPFIYDGCIFAPINAAPQMIKPIDEIAIEIQNQESSNPL